MNAPISPERAKRIRSLFSQLIEVEGRSRVERLEAIHETDPELGEELESLLAAAERLTGSSVSLDWLLGSVRGSLETEKDLVGTTVSHFRIIEPIGQGGMGVVYRAEDVRLNRMAALKFLPRHMRPDETARERFMQEARAASRLDHPNVCTVYEVDRTEDGRTFIAMPCYEGETIASMKLGEDMSIGRAVDYASQVLSGLEAAHRQGIVHRDVKPANLFVTTEATVKILDFGVAKLATAELTRTGAVMGTTAYMSPEQVRGEAVDARTDIWSVGAVLYEMLSGRRPFGGPYELAVMYEILHRDPEPLPERVPQHVRRVVMRCLAKDPAERFGSAEEVAEALAGDSVRTTSPPAVSRKWVGVSAATVTLIVVAVVAATLSGPGLLGRLQSIIGTGERSTQARAVVVLPFSSYNADERRTALSDGLFEIVTSRLSQLQTPDSIWILPSMDVRDSGIRSVERAREAFGASLAVTGSTHWTDDSVRVSINLVDAVTLRQISSEIITRSVEDAGSLPIDAARSAAGMIGLQSERASYIRRLADMMGLTPSRTRDLIGDQISTAPGAVEFFVTAKGYLHEYDRVDDIDAAIDLLVRATTLDPEFALAYAALGQAHWRKYELTGDQNNVGRAAAYSDTAAVLGEDLASVQVSVGTVQRGIGRLEDARESLTRALEVDNDNADAHRELGKLYQDFAALDRSDLNLQHAEEHLKRAQSLRPEYWATYRDLGVFYYQTGRFEDATVQFERALSLAPRNPTTYTFLGAAYQMLGQFESARETFESALQYDPGPRTYAALGAVYFNQHQYERAAEYYRKAIDENEADYWNWAGLAESMYWSDSLRAHASDAFDRAIQMGEEARSVNPRDYQTTSYLATLYAYRGNIDRALSLIGDVLEMVPDDGQVLAHAAEIHSLAGNHSRAASYVDRSLESGFQSYYVNNSPLLARYAHADTDELPKPKL